MQPGTEPWRFTVTSRTYEAIIAHCRRKIRGEYVANETRVSRAFGLVAGTVDREASVARITAAFPLRRNLRLEASHQDEMDEILDEFAIPSKTPNALRGWVADPMEVLAADRICSASGTVLLGAYHSHKQPWPTDPDRSSCTALDTFLARDRGLWVFIVSMVRPDAPIFRAFFEGDNDREALIEIEHPEPTR